MENSEEESELRQCDTCVYHSRECLLPVDGKKCWYHEPKEVHYNNKEGDDD